MKTPADISAPAISFEDRVDHPFFVAFVAMALYSCLFAGHLGSDGWDPGHMVVANVRWTDPARADRSLPVSDFPTGYDGQYYFRTAAAPLSNDVIAEGIQYDFPRYRQGRILYPLLARIMSAVLSVPLTWSLPLVNLCGVGLLGWFAGLLCQRNGAHALWGLVFPLYPGLALSFSRDLTEIIQGGFILATLYEFQRYRFARATLYFALAAFTKETTFAMAPVFFAAALRPVHRTWRAGALSVSVVPTLVYFFWWAFLWYRWRDYGGRSFPTPIYMPFKGIVEYVRLGLTNENYLLKTSVTELVLLGLFVLAAAVVLRKSAAPAVVKISWAVYLSWLACLSRGIWVEDWSYLRAATEMYLLGAVIILGCGKSLRWALFGVVLCGWFVLSANVLLFR